MLSETETTTLDPDVCKRCGSGVLLGFTEKGEAIQVDVVPEQRRVLFGVHPPLKHGAWVLRRVNAFKRHACPAGLRCRRPDGHEGEHGATQFGDGAFPTGRYRCRSWIRSWI